MLKNNFSMKIKIKKSKILHISFAILLVCCVQFSINTFISLAQFSKKLLASIRNGESLGIATRKSFLAIKESEYKRDNIFVHKATAATPSCTITSPTTGATVFGITNATVDAQVISSGIINSVELKLDGALLNTSSNAISSNIANGFKTSTYSIPWNTVQSSDAIHSLTCVTVNNYETGLDSGPSSVTVANPPIRSNGVPSSNLPAGTTSTSISLSTTNENAICKYSEGSDATVTYAAMPNMFSTTGGTTHSSVITGLTDGVTKTYHVRCQDAALNVNTDDFAITFSVLNPGSDSIAPSVPQNLSGAAASSSQIDLIWSASTDNVAVAGYKIYRDAVQIGTTNNLNYSDTSASASTSYQYAISAYDGAANESLKSAVILVQTPAAPAAPVAPAVAVATESESDSKEKDQPSPNRVIKQNYSKIRRGETLIQSGKRFSKNSFVDLYFSRLDLSFYPPVRVKTSSKGTFSMNYVAKKAIGKYKWYAVDVKSGRKSRLMRYEITAGATKKQSSGSSKTTKSS